MLWDFNRTVKIEKLQFLSILRYKFDKRISFDLDSFVSYSTNSKILEYFEVAGV